MLVVVDGPMVKYHGKKVRHYVLTLMQIVSHVLMHLLQLTQTSNFISYSVLSSQTDLDFIDTLALVLTRKSLVTLLVDGFDAPIKTTGS